MSAFDGFVIGLCVGLLTAAGAVLAAALVQSAAENDEQR